jgi:hypothetical protein
MDTSEALPAGPARSTDIGLIVKRQVMWLTLATVRYVMGACCFYCSTIYAAQLQWLSMICCWISGGCLYSVGPIIELPKTPTGLREPPPTGDSRESKTLTNEIENQLIKAQIKYDAFVKLYDRAVDEGLSSVHEQNSASYWKGRRDALRMINPTDQVSHGTNNL